MKLQYMLKQQTPMIHFQAKENGAILRATEVKPKLDRFIRAWMKKEERDIPKDWLTDKDHEAFDYKMKIVNKQVGKKTDPSMDLYFGNMGKGPKKQQIMYHTAIGICIMCFHEELSNVIAQSIRTFFLVTNFGTRQSKGLGGFTIDDTTELQAEQLLAKWYGTKPIYKINYPNDRGITADNILYDGSVIYKILKGGVNENGTYIKSFLTRYFLRPESGIAGEKRYIKSKGIGPAIYQSRNAHIRDKEKNENRNLKYRYIRGLLGATDGVQYIHALDTHNQAVRDNDGKILKDKIVYQGNNVERIPSPIQFKVVGKTLFIIPNDVEERIYGAQFTFSSSYSGKSEPLNIPNKDEFDMDEMFALFVNELNGALRSDIQKYNENKKKAQNEKYRRTIYFAEKELKIEVCKEETNE